MKFAKFLKNRVATACMVLVVGPHITSVRAYDNIDFKGLSLLATVVLLSAADLASPAGS